MRLLKRKTEGIVEVLLRKKKEHVSVKLAMAQLGGAPQLDLQMAVVNALKENLKENGRYTIWNIAGRKVNQFKPKKEENKPKTIEGPTSQK